MVECTVRGATSADAVEERSRRRALRCDMCVTLSVQPLPNQCRNVDGLEI